MELICRVRELDLTSKIENLYFNGCCNDDKSLVNPFLIWCSILRSTIIVILQKLKKID
jgi:hypothetical protein